MNRKYGIFATLLMFLSINLSFAAQMSPSDQVLYNSIVRDYQEKQYEKLIQINREDAIRVVEAHKQMLELQKKAIQSSYYGPKLLKLISGSLYTAAVIAAVIGGSAAVGSYKILESAQNAMPVIGSPGMSYPELLAYEYFDKSAMMYAKKRATEQLYIKSLPTWAQGLLYLGVKAPLLVGGSVILGGLSQYLWNKAASYTNEIARLNQEIIQDQRIIDRLQPYEFQ